MRRCATCDNPAGPFSRFCVACKVKNHKRINKKSMDKLRRQRPPEPPKR